MAPVGSALARGAAALLLPWPCVPRLWFVPAAHGSWTASLLPGWWGGRGERTLPSGGWRWNSQGLAGRAGDHQPVPSPEEPFGINLLKMESSSLHPQFGDSVSEVYRCCLNVVIASNLRCDLCLALEVPSSPSAQFVHLPSFYYYI